MPKTWRCRRWAWLKKMPKPPTRNEVISEILVSHLDPYTPKVVAEIHNDIINDYGFVTERLVYRYVADLLKRKKIMRIVEGDEYLGYVRVVRKRPRRCQTVAVGSVSP